ncbi:MAG: PQQ-binding-like beta-propeller repeat protein [Chloroflexota bacterium]|nr:PQQ-binding-like beta-propeller repeat protein [Chloroflexota bacterium]
MTHHNGWHTDDFITRARARIQQMEERADELTDALGTPREAKYDLLSMLAAETQPGTWLGQVESHTLPDQQIAPLPLLPGNGRGNRRRQRFMSFATGLVALLLVSLLVGSALLLFSSRPSLHPTTTGGTDHSLAPPIVVMGTTDGLLALRSRDGSLLWHYHAEQGHRFVNPLILLWGAIVYAASLDGHVYALHSDTGKLIWQQTVSPVSPGNSRFSADQGRIAADHDIVAIDYTRLLIPLPDDNEGITYVFRAQNGASLWHHERLYQEVGLLGVDNKAVYITDMLKRFQRQLITRALRARDGKELWSNSAVVIQIPVTQGASSLVVVNGIIYGYSQGNGLVALDTTNGKLLWKQKAADDSFVGQVIVGNGEIYLDTANRFCAYQMSNGSQRWCTYTRHTGNYFEEFEQVVFMNGMVYVGHGSFNPQSFWIEAWDSKGVQHWVWPPVGSKLRTSVLSPDTSWMFAGSNGVLYIPSMDGLYAIRASDGHQLWYVKKRAAYFELMQ